METDVSVEEGTGVEYTSADVGKAAELFIRADAEGLTLPHMLNTVGPPEMRYHEYQLLELSANKRELVLRSLRAPHLLGYRPNGTRLVDGLLFVIMARDVSGANDFPMDYEYHWGRIDRGTLAGVLTDFGAEGYVIAGMDVDVTNLSVILHRPHVEDEDEQA